jgi:hypothetical protein
VASLYKLFESIDVPLTKLDGALRHYVFVCQSGRCLFLVRCPKILPRSQFREDLATRTMSVLTFGFIPTHIAILLLALWECLIGLGLILGAFMRATLLLLWLQMLGTITPIFFFPQEVFARIPIDVRWHGYDYDELINR